ncbi:MAG: glycosyltransferase 87 family protein, partial [Dehalococcoidia bacterium]
MNVAETHPMTGDRTATPTVATPPVRQDPRGVAFARSLWARLTRSGPYLVATILLILGYFHYREGAFYSLSERFYRAWAFPEFRYSDLIWLYLRDGLAQQPIPYLDYPLEYPPLTGLVTFLLSFLPDLPTYFLVTYLVLALSALGTIWALRRLPGANPWLFAAAPALFFYTGHQWDGIAIFVTAISLVAIACGRERWGVFGLAVGVSLKLFPVVFVAALLIDRLRQRQWRAVAEIAAVFGLATIAFNLPVALADVEGWSFFFRWNRDRLADSGVWVLWRGLPTTDATTFSLVAVAVGGLIITALALRARGP